MQAVTDKLRWEITPPADHRLIVTITVDGDVRIVDDATPEELRKVLRTVCDAYYHDVLWVRLMERRFQ